MSADGILKLLIDTNVWMDYFSVRSDRTADVARLFEIADVSEQIALFASSLSVKDVLSRRRLRGSAEGRMVC